MPLRLLLVADNIRATGFFHRWRKDKRYVYSFIRNEIVPEIIPSMLDCYLPESYPWCFVIPPEVLKRKRYCVGAFIILRGENGELSVVVIYTCVPVRWLMNNLRSRIPVTFWMARILKNIHKIDLMENNWRGLRQWVTALQRSYSPFWEKFALAKNYRFKNRSCQLLGGCSELDCRVHDHDGVDMMPWKNWPECIQGGASTWLWRQSNHMKILDSREIQARRAEEQPSEPLN